MSFQLVFSLLVTITAIACYINHVYLKLPKTIGLTIISMLVSLGFIIFLDANNPIVKAASSIDFRDTVLNGMIAYLLFAGALHVNVLDLKKEMKAVISLATVSVLISVVIVATLVYWLAVFLNFPISYGHCLVFGALISPTDPIAVLAVFKQTKQVPKKMKMRILGESLFNDAAGIIIFVVLAGMFFYPNSHSDHITITHIMWEILIEAGGGIGLGLLFGWFAVWFMRRADNPEVAIFITLAVSSMGYYVAQALHTSGPVAMVVAGLIIGNSCSMRKNYSEETVRSLDSFWGIIDDMLNAFLFVLIGLELLEIKFHPMVILLGVFSLVIILIARYISVALPVLLIDRRTSWSYWRENTMMTWGGIRGGISIALALSLPIDTGGDIVSLAYVVVLMSILIQGSTFGRVVKHLFPTKESDSSSQENDTDPKAITKQPLI